MLTANGTLSKVPVRVLIDSGATLNYASTSLVQRHDALSQQVSNGPKYRVRQGDGTRTVASRHLYNVKLILQKYTGYIDVLCTHLGNWDLILGRAWLDSVNPDIDWTTNIVRDRTTGEVLVIGQAYNGET